MQNTNIIAAEQTPNTISASNAVFNVQALGQLTAFAELMAQSAVTVPKHLAGKPADCMAIVMQAMQWGMNPYAVAQKTHLVNGVLGYEAQLVNAVISSSSAIVGRFHYEYGGDWEKIAGKKDGRDELGLFVRVGAVLRGETDITWGENIYLADITTRNSPLWKTAPKQQIAYLAVKYWARLYCPEVILGVYSPDEVEPRTEKEINPAPQRVNLADIHSDTVTTTHSAQESAANVDAMADDFRDRIDAAETLEAAAAVGNEINDAKAALGTTLFTELKNKATRRYHLVKHRNAVEAAINSLPQPGEPGAVEQFAEAERVLAAAKRHMGDDLHDQFSITLADMKPEYVA
ncbi:RecT family [Leclercia adecarboxylata]|uniref:Enterohemolysin n=1 Tax=Leclercia adecarboxylata TaxID=83655 RepID=A0A855F7V2_9ENTR|nr:RecT family recombinase [Leclercia adecarboxylata]PHH07016.1 enterohemolysin [Leclercia adecarboxylata]UBH69318.1 recombinase RecT [Leclercia adecarboxylata]SPX62913.1 RecT family [Leclercia adecarboxylata]